jgi:hypothetical protein
MVHMIAYLEQSGINGLAGEDRRIYRDRAAARD